MSFIFRFLIFYSSLTLVTSSRIFCLIHTATSNHDTRAQVIYETWAQRCDGFFFFTNSPMKPEIPHVVYPTLNTRDHSWEKIRRVFQLAAENYTSYDWFLRADDDAYVVVDNARAFLSKYKAKDKHFFGLKWSFFVNNGFADGSCYMLSNSTVQSFNSVMKDPTKCRDYHRAEEDQEIAKCLAEVGIYPEDTRDAFGSDRIQHHHPINQFDLYKDEFAVKYSYYPVRPGIENFSQQMISFHHVSPFEMRFIHYLLYQLDRKLPPKIPPGFY